MTVCIVSILHDESQNIEGYRGAEVSARYERDDRVFCTADPVKDFKDALDYAETLGNEVAFSSSVDHFVNDVHDADGEPMFEWATEDIGMGGTRDIFVRTVKEPTGT